MLKSFFRKSSVVEPAAVGVVVQPTSDFLPDGIAYKAPAGISASEWLSSPFGHPERADLGARLGQLFTEGHVQLHEDHVLLPWSSAYALMRDPELQGYRDALDIPSDSPARPRLVNRGALVDADFSVQIAEWVDPQGRAVQPAPRLVGAVLVSGPQATLLPEPVHQLLQELQRFHATPPSQRDKAFKELSFGRMRKLAARTGSPMSDYVARTIVLTPERLQLAMRRSGEGDGKTVEVIPGFEEAPGRWLEMFDRLPLQNSYDVPDGASLVRVVPAPEVKAVLAEIKRMPGRRASGARAEAFVRNPFAVLGEQAQAVIEPEQFEAAREAAGIRFERFTPRVGQDEHGQVLQVGLLIESLGNEAAEATLEWFGSPLELGEFTDKLQRRIDAGAQCCTWQGYELEILGDTGDHLAQLEHWLHLWRHPPEWSAAEVLDLGNYSQRVEAIGVEQPFVVPVIVHDDESNDWFEDNVQIGLKVREEPGGVLTTVPLSFGDIPSLESAVQAAEVAGQDSVQLPGLRQPVPIAEARAAVDALLKAREQLKPKDSGSGGGQPLASSKTRLVIKRNLEGVDYTEQRAHALEMPEGAQPLLPAALRASVKLKSHQHVGIAWLQHLWSLSPEHCRGTVLADDMGLGKTLQLLTFIVSCFEREPELPPALVVAPVALLENWRNELEKFFVPGTLPLLMLYGETLRNLRVSRHELDEELRDKGITRLLKKGWIGDARIVLTTYETMRDLEFSLAAQPWSVMVCDEAQKIKTPAALVTRSAKKQKVRFRIACTGTPVENTLADLWCLFDFVQPGMLGALAQFSRTYRQPIEAKTEEQKAKVEELRAIIQPQILHRRKTDVAKDLPPLAEDEACKRLPMSPFQLRLYQGALAMLRAQRESNPSAQLQTLLAIRQICSDPHGYAEPKGRDIEVTRLVNESPKMGWLADRLKALATEADGNHKVIVFCEFRELQLTLQRVIAAFFGFAPHIINGDTSADPKAAVNRQKLIDDFQRRPGFGAIVLSPLAVGFGVNIQAANHVVHFTRTWNPAKEDQATARAWRIGQDRPVTVYYPGVVSTSFPSFDVTLDKLLTRKRSLATDMLNGCSDLKVADFADFT